MIHLHFDTDDLTQIRFALSPMWETVTSVRTFTASPPHALHARWLRQVRPRVVDAVDLELLTAVVPPAGYLPDFLKPFPARRAPSFESSLATIAASDPQLVAEQLTHLAQHSIAQQQPGRARRVKILRDLINAPEAGLARLTLELGRYWRVAVAPHWRRIRGLLQADLSYRLAQLASGGVRQLFATLHPSVTFERDTLRIVKYYNGHAHLQQRGLLLVPCAFAWPEVIVRTADPQPALTYAPRGLGRLWDAARDTNRSPLSDILGHARAAILAQLDLPMSTLHMACQLELTAPTVSFHLNRMHTAGIVAARRDGRAVLYSRTPLGDQLLTGDGECISPCPAGLS